MPGLEELRLNEHSTDLWKTPRHVLGNFCLRCNWISKIADPTGANRRLSNRFTSFQKDF